MQLFYWAGPGQPVDGRVYYQQFCLNNVQYSVGDCVFLFPETEDTHHYIGRIKSAFVEDESQQQQDPHCIEVKWYERRTNLEPSTKGVEESEREVFELEDTDINPIGCISGKCTVIKAANYHEALAESEDVEGDWFFCRGYFLHTTNSFQPYTAAELAADPRRGQTSARERGVGHKSAAASHLQPGSGNKRKATGRVCVECGATSTPQWREGPTGPKTLCNACGVRYVRAQQRANKGGGGISPAAALGVAGGGVSKPNASQQKNVHGSPRALTMSRAAPSPTVTAARGRVREEGQEGEKQGGKGEVKQEKVVKGGETGKGETKQEREGAKVPKQNKGEAKLEKQEQPEGQEP